MKTMRIIKIRWIPKIVVELDEPKVYPNDGQVAVFNIVKGVMSRTQALERAKSLIIELNSK